MNLSEKEYAPCLSFPHGDGRVMRYLKGETVPLSGEEAEGIPEGSLVLVEVDHFPLGWAKKQRMSLKNKLDPGWRING